MQRSLAELSQQAKISPEVSRYELRHTAITLQAEAGHSAWQIADWAGTSERMITDVYRHKLAETSPLGPPFEHLWLPVWLPIALPLPPSTGDKRSDQGRCEWT